jgi:hypothetical protein
MRTILAITAVAAVLLSGVDTPARADENNKLTYFTFSKPVQLPGKTLPAGKYRFELADPQESRRVIKGSDEGGTKRSRCCRPCRTRCAIRPRTRW